MKRHVIIEGPDGAGKTTLAKQLQKKYKLEYHHEGPPPAEPSALQHYAGLLLRTEAPTVFDRLHLGELVYGPLLRNGSRLKPTDIVLMDRLLNARGITTILCLPPWDVCLANTKTKEELIQNEDTLLNAYKAWDEVASNHPVDFIHDYTADSKVELERTATLPAGAIGSPDASILFVGERADGRGLDLPFFSSIVRGDNAYLNKRIVEARIPEANIALVNCLDVRGNARPLVEITKALPNLKVIVPLGAFAYRQLREEGVFGYEVYAMPHPRFWKKHHPDHPAEFSRMLGRLNAFV